MHAVAAQFDDSKNISNKNIRITKRQADFAMLAVQGPVARQAVWNVRPAWKAPSEHLTPFSAVSVLVNNHETNTETFLARTGYTGEDGFEVMLPVADAVVFWNDLLAAGVAPCGLAARDTLRMEAGMALYGNDLGETHSPLDTGLAWTIDLKPLANGEPRDFIGRAALEAHKSSGQVPAFMGLILQDKGVMRGHMKVQTALGTGGTTSGTFSPTMNQSIALARLPKSETGSVAVGDVVQVEIRGKFLPARVVKLPFVRNNTVLV